MVEHMRDCIYDKLPHILEYFKKRYHYFFQIIKKLLFLGGLIMNIT